MELDIYSVKVAQNKPWLTSFRIAALCLKPPQTIARRDNNTTLHRVLEKKNKEGKPVCVQNTRPCKSSSGEVIAYQ